MIFLLTLTLIHACWSQPQNAWNLDLFNTWSCGLTEPIPGLEPGVVWGQPVPENARIYGGELVTDFQSMPWLVMISFWAAPDNPYQRLHNTYCSGSVITNYWILTAAHCLHYFTVNQDRILYENENIEVFAGGPWLRSNITGEESMQFPFRRRVDRIFPHPNWHVIHNTGLNDIALIRMSMYLPFYYDANGRFWVNSICLPTGQYPIDLDREYRVAGYGKLGRQENVLRLLYMLDNVTVHPYQDCGQLTADFVFRFARENLNDPAIVAPIGEPGQEDARVVCRVNVDQRMTCPGDSGGPVFYQRADGRWEIAATVQGGNRFRTYHRFNDILTYIRHEPNHPQALWLFMLYNQMYPCEHTTMFDVITAVSNRAFIHNTITEWNPHEFFFAPIIALGVLITGSTVTGFIRFTQAQLAAANANNPV